MRTKTRTFALESLVAAGWQRVEVSGGKRYYQNR
jgi:hypothetical protein